MPHALQGRFDPDNFNQAVVDVAQKLVPLTVTLWNKVSAKMLPTPAKFHYLFNMRELSKVHAVFIFAILHTISLVLFCSAFQLAVNVCCGMINAALQQVQKVL